MQSSGAKLQPARMRLTILQLPPMIEPRLVAPLPDVTEQQPPFSVTGNRPA